MVKLVKHDLEFVLKQIAIAEQHAAGGDLAALVAGYNGNDGLTQAHLLPDGLRTVDGSYNNLLPGRELWGAADQSFPGIFTPAYLNDADGDRYDFNPAPNGPGPDGIIGTSDDTGVSWYTNNDYANAGPRTGSQPGPGSGTVIDADPRIISNLIVDQTLANPAAIAAALTHAGMSGQPLMTALGEITSAYRAADALAPSGNTPPTPEYTAAKDALDAKLAQYGVEMDGNTVYLPNVSPDEGLSSPFNGWMTIFGQFFDHGLDLVAKGGNGTVYVPLAPDDPLYSTAPGAQNYIPLTRVSVNPGPDGRLGTADDGLGPKNLTTPWVDQNQTYASTASKQIFMREYVPGPDGKPMASGHLLEGANGGLATWADIKNQAREVLGIELTDLNVGNIPLIASDPYGNFIPGANGYPQLVVGMGPDGQLGTADDVLREGNPAAPVSAQGVVLTGHAFLDDIAHAAVPIVAGGVLQQDSDAALGYANADGSPGPQGQRGPTAYDNELLDRHFIAGDGRANENIALTAVHQVFHAEHNRIVEMTKTVALESGDLAFLNEWLLVDVAAVPTTQEAIDALVWDGERLFQVGRFTNEMEYQHLVFEEFGRMMQPDIDAFVFEPSADINPSIAAEFAHVVYRFGHSMLRQDIGIIEMVDGQPVMRDVTLFDGFLNPVMYDSLGDAEAASGAIIRGMSRQVGSEIDEFVTDVLRNQLLGIPLDLAAINIARGRDVGMPSLQTARTTFFAATGDTLLKPYTSWADFALNLKNPASIINFIAAYGTHASLANPQSSPKTIEQLREAATLLVLGGDGAPADRLDFLNATGAYANDAKLGGLNDIDFWMGGLAEKKMAFGGMLGSTFSFVFQMTMENLQDADRFYYLSRTQGLNLLNELENNTFAELVMRNTDLGAPGSTALPGNLFSAFEMPTLEMDISKQLGADPVSDDPFLGGFSSLVERRDANGDGIAEYIRVNSNEHFTIGGTEGDDVIVSGGGDDAIWGRGGNDRIEAGYGVDKVFGGAGDDIITNAGTDIGESDFLHGNEGNDVIHGGSGLALIFGNEGNDFLIAGPDGKEIFGGTGNDFILGGTGGDFLLGNEGDDWIEGGLRFDTLAGDNSELFFNSSIIGHDVLNGGSGDTDYDGESGDDIMFASVEGIQRLNGMAGFDWAVHKGDTQGANSNLGIPIFATQEAFILRDRFDLVEGLSGWKYADNLTGRVTAVNTRAEIEGTAAIPNPDSPLESYSNDLLAKNVGLVDGLAALVAHLGEGIPVTKVVNGQVVPVLDENGVQERFIFRTGDASDILLGGGGSDVITGLAGNDIIDGDKWLNVRIRLVKDGVVYTADEMAGKVYREADYVNGAPVANAVAEFGGRPLTDLMFDRTFNPGQLSIVREIVDGRGTGDVDTAVYTDVLANYSFGLNSDSSLFVDHTGFVRPQNDDGLPEEEGTPNATSDGKDTVRNIEKLQFTDVTLNVFEGTAVGETLNGTADADLLVGKGGADTLNGLGGNDILIGGVGNDVLNGGAGNDTYVFGLADGLDTVNDASGVDGIRINAAGASLSNLSFERLATGGTNADDLRIVLGASRIDILSHYSATNSSATPGSGAIETVTFAGGAMIHGYAVGADPYSLNASRALTLNGAGGNDILAAATQTGTIATTLNGGLGGDLLFGAGGIDLLNGGDGDDLLVGGAGNDVLDGGTGADVMVGGTGSDVYLVDDAGDVVTEAVNGGADRVETTLAAYTLGANVENLTYTGAGTFVGTGNELANRIVGGAGIDTLSGLAGNDTYVVTAGDIIVEVAGGGTDTVESADSYTLGAELENLILTGNATINGIGNGSANVIHGNGAANEIFAGGGNDTVRGGGGNDLIDGGTGNDAIDGGAGDDIVIGGAGDDTINVGNGNDIVRYTADGFGNDVINAFDPNPAGGQDRIDLSGLGITAANFAARVTLTAGTGANTGDTIVAVRNADNSLAGTIRVDNMTIGNGTNQMNQADFLLAAPVNTINGTAGNDLLNGSNGPDAITGGLGNDTVNAFAGDDTIIWNANATGATDGRDIVNGGTEGAAGDTFVINGNASAETYRIYTRAAWDALPNTNLNTLAAATEIVVMRQVGTAAAVIIAELAEIEEIRVNGFDPAGATGSAGNDTFEIIGDFSQTSLRLNTITIDGGAGDSTVDISALSSAHRIVFKSKGGNDTIVGTLRPQDVIELPEGASPADYTSTTDENGVTSMTDGSHTIRYTANGSPQVGGHHGHDDDDDRSGHDDDDQDDGDVPATPAPTPVAGTALFGTAAADLLRGGAGDDTLVGLEGDDVLLGEGGADIARGGAGHDLIQLGDGDDVAFGNEGNDEIFGGGGNDMLFGDLGHDRIFAGAGDDVIEGGAHSDTVYAGEGDDIVIATNGDGTDVYWGEAGIDTLNYAAVTADLTVDLGNGLLERGSVSSALTGVDTIYGFENFIGGSGNDTIVASNAVNVIDGGSGNDLFVFNSVTAANGDSIVNFRPGDRIDLSGMDANNGLAGKQGFALAPAGFTGAGQIQIMHETRADGEHTLVQGNVTDGSGPDFTIDLVGRHNLTLSDFSGVGG